MRTLRILALASIAALAACGSDDDEGGTSVVITGAQSLTATSATSFALDTSCGPVRATGFAVLASNVANACDYLRAGQEKQGAAGALVGVVRANLLGGTPPPVAPGTYEIARLSDLLDPAQLQSRADLQGNVTLAFARSSSSNATCGDVVSAEAVGGTVTLTSVANGDVAGTVSAALDAGAGGGNVTGSFSGASCAFDNSGLCTGDLTPDGGACVP